jgi:hypothetical protein
LWPKNVEAQEVIEVDEEKGENIWFQWDGKLSGIPVEPWHNQEVLCGDRGDFEDSADASQDEEVTGVALTSH